MNFNARRTLPTDRFANTYINDKFLVEHVSGLVVYTCPTWCEAVIWRDRFEADDRAAQELLSRSTSMAIGSGMPA